MVNQNTYNDIALGMQRFSTFFIFCEQTVKADASQISNIGRTPRTSSGTPRAPCFLSGSLATRRPRPWRSPPSAGTLATTTSSRLPTGHVRRMFKEVLKQFDDSHRSLFLDNFYEQDSGEESVVCVYSLKNPSYPEYLCKAHCGVMCVDIHPKHPHMLAVGLADGSVAVFNLQVRRDL